MATKSSSDSKVVSLSESGSSSSEITIAIRVDFSEGVKKDSKHIVSVDSSKSVTSFAVAISRLLGIDRDALARYTVRAIRLGVDVIDLDDDNAKLPLTDLGIGTGWTLLYGAPADLKPPRRKRVKPGEETDGKGSGSDDEKKFAGITPTNCFTKLSTAKGKTAITILEFIDIKWQEIVKADKKGVLALPATVFAQILKSDKLNGQEVELWNLAVAWARESMKRKSIKETGETLKTELGPLLPHIRLPTLSPADLAAHVAPLNVLTSDQVLALFSHAATVSAEKKSGSSSSKKEVKKGSEGPRVAGFLSTPRTGSARGVSFTFDPSRKSSYHVISGENRVLTGTTSGTNSITLGTKSFREGVNYWEMKIDRMGSNSGYLTFGVGSPTVGLSDWAGSACYVWGNGSTSSYSQMTSTRGSWSVRVGDTVGILLDLDRGIMQMYVDKKWQCEVNIPKGSEYVPVFAVLSNQEQITLIENPTLPSPIKTD